MRVPLCAWVRPAVAAVALSLPALPAFTQTAGLPAEPPSEAAPLVDLSGETLPSIDGGESAHTLAMPWWRRIEIGGFGGVGYLRTGADGTRPFGGFTVHESSLFVTAHAWAHTDFFLELQTNRVGQDDDLFVRTAEVYAHGRDLLSAVRPGLLGVKVGRIDIPFGDEYLYQDISDNPLISWSAAYAYGWDEGALVYGQVERFGWILSVMDGSNERHMDDTRAKAGSLKLWGRPARPLYLSASVLANGETAQSGLKFGGSFIMPVGASHSSTLGTSPSLTVRALMGELDGRLELPRLGHLFAAVGHCIVDDADDSFDRRFTWFHVEPVINLGQRFYAAARYSEIGTYDPQRGYHFNGKITAGGNAAFGYDTMRLQRVSAGVGWRQSPRSTVKVEWTRDRFHLIEGTSLDASLQDRDVLGAIWAVSF